MDNVFLVNGTAYQVVSSSLLSSARLVGTGGVGDDHGVTSHLVLKEVEDAVLLHEPGNKVEVCLPILNAVLNRRIIAVEPHDVVGKPAIFEDLFQDLLDRFVMKNLAIGISSEQPGPGNHLHLVTGEARVGAALREVAHYAVKITLRLVRLSHSYGDRLADDCCEVD